MVTTTLPTGALAPGQTEQVGSKAAVTLLDSLLSQPSLPQGTSLTPQAQSVQANELLATPGVTGTLAAQAGVGIAPTAAAAAAPTTTAIGALTPQAAAAYTGQVVGTAPTMAAATGAVTAPMTAAQQAVSSLDPKATVRGQLESITTDIEASLASGSNLPAFARGAAEAAKATMQARGLGASTMLAEALAEGILKSSIPIAAADAQTYKEVIFQNLSNNQQAALINAQSYLQMDLSNLSNAQQSSLQNLHASQQTLLSDNAARNAALQFNATSQNQVNQFYENLNTGIQSQNAQRSDAMGQFTTAESNKIAALNAKDATAIVDANAQRETAISQFNKTLEDARARFNVENQRVIDQSNAVWRRSINTANNTAANASNETNAMNLLNLSNFAMSGLWQQWRDEASWVQTTSQNVDNRDHNMAIAALERTTAFDLQNSAQKAALYGLLGQFGMEVFAKWRET